MTGKTPFPEEETHHQEREFKGTPHHLAFSAERSSGKSKQGKGDLGKGYSPQDVRSSVFAKGE